MFSNDLRRFLFGRVDSSVFSWHMWVSWQFEKFQWILAGDQRSFSNSVSFGPIYEWLRWLNGAKEIHGGSWRRELMPQTSTIGTGKILIQHFCVLQWMNVNPHVLTTDSSDVVNVSTKAIEAFRTSFVVAFGPWRHGFMSNLRKC